MILTLWRSTALGRCPGVLADERGTVERLFWGLFASKSY
jgi:hypothetical protein